jgi:hypothetical protein
MKPKKKNKSGKFKPVSDKNNFSKKKFLLFELENFSIKKINF